MVDREYALDLHRKAMGKTKLVPTVNIRNKDDISMAYLKGGAVAVEEIFADPDKAYDLTGKRNKIAIVSNGTSVLGFGDRGPVAVIPMIEGKSLLYKKLADVDAIPLCVDLRSIDELEKFCRCLEPTFGAVTIEDIKSPMDYMLVRRLRPLMNVPFYSDDMQSTSVVALGGLINAAKILEKDLQSCKVVIVGAGTGGLGVAEIFYHYGIRNTVLLNSRGILDPLDPLLNEPQRELSTILNPEGLKGGLMEAVRDADVLIGLTGVPGLFKKEHIETMASKPIVFAFGRPEPEIDLDYARECGAAIVASSHISDTNGLPNLLAYPGITRGLLDVRAKELSKKILLELAIEFANLVDSRRLREDNFAPRIFSDELVPRMAEATAQACIAHGFAREFVPKGQVYEQTWSRLFGGRPLH